MGCILSYSLPSTLASCTMFPKYSLLLLQGSLLLVSGAPLQDNTACLARVRREPQPSQPAGGTETTDTSAVVGTGTLDPGSIVNFLGAILSPRRVCRWVWNSRDIKFYRICEDY